MIVLGGCFMDGKRAVLVTNEGCENVLSLISDQEEADTRLLLNAKHGAETQNRIVIQSPDTDVAVLIAAHFQSHSCNGL